MLKMLYFCMLNKIMPLIPQNSYSFTKSELTFDPKKILEDYQLAVISRQCSLLVRKEVFTGRAKFGLAT